MEYEKIRYDLENSPHIKLLRSRNAPLTISFLYQQFKQKQQISIPESELTKKLEDYLEFLRKMNPTPICDRPASSALETLLNITAQYPNHYVQKGEPFWFSIKGSHRIKVYIFSNVFSVSEFSKTCSSHISDNLLSTQSKYLLR